MRTTIQVGMMTDPGLGKHEFVTLIVTDGDKMIVTQMEPSYALALGNKMVSTALALADKAKT